MSLPQVNQSFDRPKESFVHQAHSEVQKQLQASPSIFIKKGYQIICLLITILALICIFASPQEQREPIAVEESPVELQGNPHAQQSISSSNVIALQKDIVKGLCILQPNINLSVESLSQNDVLGGHIRKHVDCYDPKSSKQVTSCFSSWEQFKQIYLQFNLDTCIPEEVDVRNNIMKEHQLALPQRGTIKKYRTNPQICSFRTVKIVYKLIKTTNEKYYWIVLTAYPSDCQ